MPRGIMFVAASWLMITAIIGQEEEPTILIPRLYRDPAGWFEIQVPTGWEQKDESELGRRTVRFHPGDDEANAGRMELGVTLIMEWRERQPTGDALQKSAAAELRRLQDYAMKEGIKASVQDSGRVILARLSALEQVVEETAKDGKQTVVRLFVLPTYVHTYAVQSRTPKEDELSPIQLERMVKSLRILSPQLEAYDLDQLREYPDAEMGVTMRCPAAWSTKSEGQGNDRRILIASPQPKGPTVVVRKIADAPSRFQGQSLNPEGIIQKYRDLAVQEMEKTYGKVVLHPESSLASIGPDAALAYQLEFLSGDQTRYALLVMGMHKGTLAQALFSAPAEQFAHYAPLFGRMLSTLNAFAK